MCVCFCVFTLTPHLDGSRYDSSLVSKDCYIPPSIDSQPWYASMPQIDRGYTSVMPPLWMPTFEESESSLITRCSNVMSKLLAAHSGDLVVVSHAPCLLAFALALSGNSIGACRLKPAVLGGVTCFERNEEGVWALMYENRVDHLSGDARGGIGGWTLQ